MGKGNRGEDVVGVDSGSGGVLLDRGQDGRDVCVGRIFAKECHLLCEIEIERAPEVVGLLREAGVWTGGGGDGPFWGDEVKEGRKVVLFLVRRVRAHIGCVS